MGLLWGVIRSEINEELCRLKVNLDAQKPLRRGIFVSTNSITKSWISFKYEKLSVFYFGYGRMGHGLTDCRELSPSKKTKARDDPPYTSALKAESNLLREGEY